MVAKGFFFDPETKVEPTKSQSGTFFSTLEEAGVIQSADQESMPIEKEGEMSVLKTQFLILEFGSYKDDYSLHIEPCHDKKNLDSPYKVELAVVEALKLLRPATGDIRIDVYLPKEEWKKKIISLVVRGAMKSWYFNQVEFEASVPSAVFDAVQHVIMHGKEK
jgi:hypothetical protein